MESDFHKWQSCATADLNNILIFVKAAQFKTNSRATRALAMPISGQRELSVFESQLDVTPSRRTIRRVTLTARGREWPTAQGEYPRVGERLRTYAIFGKQIPAQRCGSFGERTLGGNTYW